jgi:hypothetical protein
MRLDIYQRFEINGLFSYLAVPEGQAIPEEATNTDWQSIFKGLEMPEEQNNLSQFAIDDPLEQISAKGYAITSVRHLDAAAGQSSDY